MPGSRMGEPGPWATVGQLHPEQQVSVDVDPRHGLGARPHSRGEAAVPERPVEHDVTIYTHVERVDIADRTHRVTMHHDAFHPVASTNDVYQA